MDKPIYQPGQTVKFRVLYVDSRLRPILSSIDEVLVETPSGTRVSHWTQVVTHKGLGDFQLQLSDEPELGIWRISTTRRNYQVDNTFTVAEYVLPKFQVIINPPAYVTLSTPYITLEICAKYTYGEPVSGYADVSACLLENRWYYRISEKNICYFGSVELDNRDGCAYMNISRESLGYDKEGISWMGLQLAYDGYVVEKGTDVMINATRTANSFSVNDLKLSIEGSDSCKPGIEYSGKVLAIYRDKALAAGKNISISLSDATYKYTKYYTSDEKGEVLFTLPPLDQKVSSLQLTAEAVDYPSTSHNFQRPSTSKNLHMWYSPSGSYLLFLTPQQKLTCNAQAELGLVYTTNRRENVSLSILVVGPADIISYSQENISLETDRRVGDGESFFSWNRSEDRSSRYRWSPPDLTNSSGQDNKDENTTNVAYFYGHLNISVGITASMFPSTSILVYYIKADGEVVADQVKVDVSYCTANKVSMEFSKRRGNPGEDVKVSLQAAPLSLCSYKVVDKSVYLKGDSEDLTQDAVANLRNYYTLGLNSGSYNDVNNYCEKKLAGSKNKLERWKRSMVIFPRYSRELKDSKTAFDLAGVVVMSDLALETRPCDTKTRSQYLQRFMPPVAMSTGGVAMTQRLYGERLPSLTVRDYFPETWLWDLIEIDSEGLVEVESELPHTITEWVGSAICLNEEEGLGVSPSQSVTTYQSFFTSATLPYSAIRGETIPVALSVFNYLDTCLPVQLRLKSSAEYSVEGVSTINTCVCSKDSATHTFPVVLSSIGLVNLTATATIIQNEPDLCSDNKTIDESLVGVRDAIIKGLIVEPEGAPRDYTVSEFICQSASGASQMKNVELPLPDSNLVVPDSVRSSISVVGDLMGPALDNVDDLLRMPYGCGEQNMVGFSPNVFVLQYLEGQGRDSEEVRKRAVTHMQSGK
ncbi:pregnancy zone protein-like [Watersipora subatra]|uniref:pregnancy zone protein-like n=1 Tax=Watersipora subatra TaxID=2589382 RepID=UPI00355BF022